MSYTEIESEEEIKKLQKKKQSSKKSSKVFIEEETELDSEKTSGEQLPPVSGWTEMKDNKSKGSKGKLISKHSPREQHFQSEDLSEGDSQSSDASQVYQRHNQG